MPDDYIDITDMTAEQIADAVNADPAVVAAKRELADAAADYWRSVSPADSGEYVDSVTVVQDGPSVAVVAKDPKAHIIEYGTTDTPEFAPRAKTEEHFNGG